MRFSQVSTGAIQGSARLAFGLVFLYVLILFPAIRFTFPSALWVLDFGASLFYFVSLIILILLKKISLPELGFSLKRNHLIFAAILIASIAFVPFALDLLISLTGINQYEFFLDSINKHAPGINTIPLSILIAKVFLVPLLAQTFLTGFVTQQIIQKNNSFTGIYGAGILFMLFQFDLSIGLFILGCLSALLFKKTGTLYPSIGLHMGCVIAGLLVANVYPRLYTLIGLLY